MSSEGRILVVDDDAFQRQILKRRLEGYGFEVAQADGGAAGIAQIEADRFDVVLLDLMMPEVDGLDVLKHVRKERATTQLPIVMLTAKEGSSDIVQALNVGANDYVGKSADFTVILARIRTQIEACQSVRRIVELQEQLGEKNRHLQEVNEQLERDLEAASRIQRAYLPAAVPDAPGWDFAWVFKPCQQLGGDMLNIVRLDDDHLGFYILDVVGHGVAAALLSVSICRSLAAPPDPSSVLTVGGNGKPAPAPPPAAVAQSLSERFGFNPDTGQFFTIFYGALNLHTGDLRYVTAGHPGPIHLAAGSDPVAIDTPGFPIGVGDEQYAENQLQLARGDRLYIYSDGVIEASNPQEKLFGSDRFMGALDRQRRNPLAGSIDGLVQEVEKWCGDGGLDDDVSVLGLEFQAA
ncbi:MAG: SpoIIE family protein phosphatase [Phycisphaerae bacterium]|nr:SpoIIE family protein phosphatase [Phycisphaerae bacterium]